MSFDKIWNVTITQQTHIIFIRFVVCCFSLFFAQLESAEKKKNADRRLFGIDNGFEVEYPLRQVQPDHRRRPHKCADLIVDLPSSTH